MTIGPHPKSSTVRTAIWTAAMLGATLSASCASLPGDRLVADGASRIEVSQLGEGAPVIVFESGRDFQVLYPGAEMREIDSGHDIPQERPQAVAQAIRDVLERSAANHSRER